jgi:hypothetical protein
MLFSTRRRVALNTSGGPTNHVQVKKVRKVLEMWELGCMHQSMCLSYKRGKNKKGVKKSY